MDERLFHFLVVFLIVHLIGNLTLLVGPQAFNAYAERFNAENATAIAAGDVEAKGPSSSGFILSASGIESRYVMNKSGVLDPAVMHPILPERRNEEPGIMAEMALRAAEIALAEAGLTGADIPGVIVIGGSPWTTALAEAIKKADVPVLMADPNFGNLRAARTAGIETFSGDILSEAAEQRLELVSFATLIAATSNDAYNTLVATDLAPEFGRDNVFQVMREKSESARHQLPRTLGGRKFGPEETHAGMNKLVRDGWTFRVTRLTEEFTFETWRSEREDSMLVARISPKGVISFIRKDEEVKGAVDVRIIAMRPPQSDPEVANIQPPADA